MAMIDRYINIPVIYQEYIESIDSIDESDENTIDSTGFGYDYDNVGTFKEPREILCAMDNEEVVTMGSDGSVTKLNKIVYLTKEKIVERSILNGHVILNVKPIRGFGGRIEHYESRMA